MVQPDDVLAAQLLQAKIPAQRDAVQRCLEAIRLGRMRTSLLSGLVTTGVLTQEQARYIYGEVQRSKRDRAMRVYGQLLQQHAGISPAQLQQVAQQANAQGDAEALGRALISSGLVSEAQEQDVRGRAAQAFERELSNLIAPQNTPADGHPRPGSRRFGADPRPSGGPGGNPPPLVAPTIALDPKKTAAYLRDFRDHPAVAEAKPPKSKVSLRPPQAVQGGAPAGAAGGGQGEGFLVPDWVDTQDPGVGRRVDAFEIVGGVGAGAMGVVYLARQDGFPWRRVALKLLPRDADSDAKGRFKREILANSFFSHGGALDVYGAGQTPEGEHFLAVEFFDGKDVAKIIADSGPLSPRDAAWVAKQVIETLNAAHGAGLVHRDVKPENILVSGDMRVVKLMDFGIAVIRDLGELEGQVFQTIGRAVTGTPAYVSPEQASGMTLGPSSDLYSLGVALYEMLTGRLPFVSESSHGYLTLHMVEDPTPMREGYPPSQSWPASIHDLVMKLLEKEPDDRPTGPEAVFALTNMLGELPGS